MQKTKKLKSKALPLSEIPPEVAKLLPPLQLAHTQKYLHTYAKAIDRLNETLQIIPETVTDTIFLHYFTPTAHYYICGYDGEDTMFGYVRFCDYETEIKYRKFSLSNLKSNQFIELDILF